MEYAWTQQVAVEPDLLLQDPWSLVGMMSHRDDQLVMRDDDSLTELLAALEGQNAETLRVFAEADLDASIVVPDHIQAITKIFTGQCDGCSCTSSRRWHGTPAMLTSSANPLTAQPCTSYSRP
jgi:hypothetical protein